jgi:hypothetical protein
MEHGALVGAPVWEKHKRGKNWWARISIDPQAPGGLARDFAEKARGEGYSYIVPQWAKPGTPVEFGADYYSGRGRKYTSRWYGYIEQVSADALVLVQCETAREAVRQAQEFMAEKQAQTEKADKTAWW